MSSIISSGKFSGETLNPPFNFLAQLTSGETISTQAVTATVYSGTDTTPQAVLSGAATVSGAVVTQRITGGTEGVIYKLLCTVTTSLSRTLQQATYFAIVPS